MTSMNLRCRHLAWILAMVLISASLVALLGCEGESITIERTEDGAMVRSTGDVSSEMDINSPDAQSSEILTESEAGSEAASEVAVPDMIEPPDAFRWVTPPGSELHRAAYDGSLADVNTAIELGAAVDEAIPIRLTDGEIVQSVTPLHLAAWNNTPDVIAALLELGSDINAKADGETFPRYPVILAVGNPHSRVLELLLGWQPHPWHVGLALIEAAKLDSVEAAQTLLNAGADVNFADRQTWITQQPIEAHRYTFSYTPLMVAAKHDSVQVARLLLEYGATNNPRCTLTVLHVAALNDSVETARLLLDQGAEIDTNTDMHDVSCYDTYFATGGTPLHWASAAGATRTAALLLDRGADVNAVADQRMVSALKYSIEKLTPVQLAALRNANPEVVSLLLDRGADLESDLMPPLHLAIVEQFGRSESERIAAIDPLPLINLLLDRGADIEAPWGGDFFWPFPENMPADATPLHTSVLAGSPEVTTLLLDRGANPKAPADIAGRSGLTPCEAARHYRAFTGTPLLGRLCKP